jgi:hypothetical protein
MAAPGRNGIPTELLKACLGEKQAVEVHLADNRNNNKNPSPLPLP